LVTPPLSLADYKNGAILDSALRMRAGQARLSEKRWIYTVPVSAGLLCCEDVKER